MMEPTSPVSSVRERGELSLCDHDFGRSHPPRLNVAQPVLLPQSSFVRTVIHLKRHVMNPAVNAP